MASKKDREEAKTKGVDVSGYMPPGPVSPYPPGPGPCPPGPVSPYPPGPGTCPPEHYEKMNNFACQLKKLEGQEVTAYVMGFGPAAPVPVLPTGGAGVVPSSGPMGLTGMLHEVGTDYIELHVMMNTMRVVYIPMMALAAVVPGGPLTPNVEANVVTTMPDTL